MNKRCIQAEKVLPMNTTSLLPPRVSENVERMARQIGKSPHLFVGLLFSIVSFLMGHRTTIFPPGHSKWKQRPLWWHAAIAHSGFGKSAAIAVLEDDLRMAERVVCELLCGDQTHWIYTSVSIFQIVSAPSFHSN